MRFLGIFLWLVVSALVGGWLHFRYPAFDTWAPTTFVQYVTALTAGMVWFAVGIAMEHCFGRLTD